MPIEAKSRTTPITGSWMKEVQRGPHRHFTSTKDGLGVAVGLEVLVGSRGDVSSSSL